MNKIKGFLGIVSVVVKYSAIAMVVIKTIEFFYEELSKLDLGDYCQQKILS